MFKPGLNVDLDFNRAHVRRAKAVIYDVEGTRITLSQTSPPVLPSRVGETLHLSFIVPKEERVRRIGASALVSEIIMDYELSSGSAVQAIVLTQKTEPREINLRSNFRVKIHGDSGIALTIDDDKYTLIDLSLTGLSFVQPLWQRTLNPADQINLQLDLPDRRLFLGASVRRVSSTVKSRSIAVVFGPLTTEVEDLLWKTIFMIDRKNLSR